MGQKHKRFREFRTPFPLRDICKNPRSSVRACAAGDGAICSKNRKIVPYHGANPNTRNGARLRSPSLIMAPAATKRHTTATTVITTAKPQASRAQKSYSYSWSQSDVKVPIRVSLLLAIWSRQ